MPNSLPGARPLATLTLTSATLALTLATLTLTLTLTLLGRLTERQLDRGQGAVARAEEVLHRRAVAALLHLPP